MMKKFFSRFSVENATFANGAITLFLLVFLTVGCSWLSDFGANKSDNSNSPGNSSNSSKNADNSENSKSTSGDEKVNPIPPVPPPDDLKELVNTTTKELADAMLTGDFSKAYANMSPDFQENVSEERFKDSFMRDIEQTNLTPELLKQLVKNDLEPTFSPKAYVSRNVNVKTGNVSRDVLVVEGKYDTKPQPTQFTYEYLLVDGKWKAKKVML